MLFKRKRGGEDDCGKPPAETTGCGIGSPAACLHPVQGDSALLRGPLIGLEREPLRPHHVLPYCNILNAYGIMRLAVGCCAVPDPLRATHPKLWELCAHNQKRMFISHHSFRVLRGHDSRHQVQWDPDLPANLDQDPTGPLQIPRVSKSGACGPADTRVASGS